MIDTVPHRIMVIKEGNHQIGREVNIQGRGTGDIWIYGGSLGGGSAPINVEGNITFIDVYSGYHDGDGVPVQQNIIHVGNDDSVLNGCTIIRSISMLMRIYSQPEFMVRRYLMIQAARAAVFGGQITR